MHVNVNHYHMKLSAIGFVTVKPEENSFGVTCCQVLMGQN